MPGKSDFLENKMLDHVLGGGDYVRPATLYLALYTAGPDDAGVGTEFSGSGYTRASVANTSTSFPAAVAGAKSNGVEISFPLASAAWNGLTGVAIFDAAIDGNCLFSTTFASPVSVPSGQRLQFAVGELDFTEA